MKALVEVFREQEIGELSCPDGRNTGVSLKLRALDAIDETISRRDEALRVSKTGRFQSLFPSGLNRIVVPVASHDFAFFGANRGADADFIRHC